MPPRPSPRGPIPTARVMPPGAGRGRGDGLQGPAAFEEKTQGCQEASGWVERWKESSEEREREQQLM